MKLKPDVSSFQQPPRTVDAYLDGAVADRRIEQESVTVSFVKPEPVIQKMFRLHWDAVTALKKGAAQESAQQGRRVTETEIIERLIRQYYKLDNS